MDMAKGEDVGAISNQDGFSVLPTTGVDSEHSRTESIEPGLNAVRGELAENGVGSKLPVFTHLAGQVLRLAGKYLYALGQLRFFLALDLYLFLHFGGLLGSVAFFDLGDLKLAGQFLALGKDHLIAAGQRSKLLLKRCGGFGLLAEFGFHCRKPFF